MTLPAEFVTEFLKKKEALRSQLKHTARNAVDELYDFVLTGVEKMLKSTPELNFSQVEETTLELLADANQTFSSSILQPPIKPKAKKRPFLSSTQKSRVSFVQTDNNNIPDDSVQDDDVRSENINIKKVCTRYQVKAKDVDADIFFSDSDEEPGCAMVGKYTIESISCLQCDREFLNTALLDKHNSESHNTLTYSCPLQLCNKSFKFSHELTAHKKLHSNVVSWDCYACPFNGEDMEALITHLSQEHENGKFRCNKEGCRVVSRTRAEAERHFESGNHTTSQNADNANQSNRESQEAFVSDGNFPSIPMDGKKMFHIYTIKCLENGCENDFFDETTLRQHMLNKHKKSIFSCPIIECEETFNTINNIENHVKKEHSDNGNDWSCPTCGYVEASLQQVIKHQRQLHVEGVFNCNLCNASTTCCQKAEEHYDDMHDY